MFIFTLSAWQHNIVFDHVNVHYCCCCYCCLCLFIACACFFCFFLFSHSVYFRIVIFCFCYHIYYYLLFVAIVILVFIIVMFIYCNSYWNYAFSSILQFAPCMFVFDFASHFAPGFHVGQFELNRSTSPPGGNQVDGWPPALRFWRTVAYYSSTSLFL